MELMLTPYPASVREMEGICRGRLCPAFETEGSPLRETAAKMLENARTPGAGRRAGGRAGESGPGSRRTEAL